MPSSTGTEPQSSSTTNCANSPPTAKQVNCSPTASSKSGSTTATPRGVPLHFEAQSQYQHALEQRIFTYYARLWLELRMDIASIVILGDPNPRWRPRRCVRELAGTRLDFRFRVIKLLDLDEAFLVREAERGNPAALMLLAFRRAMGAGSDV